MDRPLALCNRSVPKYWMTANHSSPDSLRGRGKVEELPHLRRSSGCSGQPGHTETFEHQAKHAPVPIDGRGFIAALCEWADHYRRDAAPAVCVVCARFIEHDNQQAVFLERSARN